LVATDRSHNAQVRPDLTDPVLGISEQAGSVERARAERDYRHAVRRTGLAVVFGIAGVLVVEALVGATAADRPGLLVTAALVVTIGIIWFAVVPRAWFGDRRVFVAAAVSEVVLLVMVSLTGGLHSLYTGYLVVPAIVLILAGSARQILSLWALVVAGIAVLALRSALAGEAPVEGAFSRLLILAMCIATCAAVALATGRQRVVTTERAAGLADESVAVRSMAMTDALTDLPNRRALPEHLARFVADAARTGLPFSVIAMDIDGLKTVNDSFGHDAGDQLLRNFAKAIHEAIRGSDVGLRVGGDEFLILLPRTTQVLAKRVAERLIETASTSAQFRPTRFSYGIATQETDELGEDVVSRADAALGTAKRERTEVSA
jgi:diguanylate cyclase (GGDEF)-like protein